ncbi:MAG: efflux RND transporter permease subunit [Lentisphaerae bacterium]|nr:efflux RND transporter permease subunit [Lentisphaerota bacterium]
MKLTQYSVHRRLATSVVMLALMVLGFYGLWRLPVDFLPDITYPVVKLQIAWPGATPDEIDKDIADPLERLMATVDNLDYIKSSSRESTYSLDVHFEYGADVDVAFQDVLAALPRAEPDLPPDINPPFVFKADPSQLPVMKLAVRSDRWGPVKLREWTDNWLQDRILGVKGVAGTEIVGGLEREIRVLIDPAALEKHHLSLETILTRLRQENVEQTGGRVTVGRKEIIARATGEFTSLDVIRSVLVARRGEHRLYLRDIATVVDSHEDLRVGTRFNNEGCVRMSVRKEAEANTVDVADAVAQRLDELRSSLPDGLEIAVAESQAAYVRQSLAGVRDAAIGAAILLVLVVYLFLGSLRQVLVMALALPFTLVLNFGLMKMAGFSLNIFSLGGLVVALGVILDNATVVLENISRLRHEEPDDALAEQAVAGTSEVGSAIVAATLSYLALFVPFLIVPGLTSLLFKELILVVAGIIVVSLVASITVIPMLAATFLHRHPPTSATRFERAVAAMTVFYGWILAWMLRGRLVVAAAFAAILIGGILLARRVGGEFLPLMNDGRIMVKLKLPSGAAVEETDRALRAIEAKLSDAPVVATAFALAGGQDRGLYIYEVANEGQLDLQLVPKAQRAMSTVEYVRKLRQLVPKATPPGVRAMPRQMPIKGIHAMQGSDILLEIRGQDTATLFELAERSAKAMRESGHLINVDISLDLSRPEYQVVLDRTKAAELGVSAADVAAALRTFVGGAIPTQYREADEYYDIRVIVSDEGMASRRDVENLAITCAGGGTVRLRDVAVVQPAVGPVEIVRKNQVKQVNVEADIGNGDLAAGVASLREILAGVERPPGYEFVFGGRAEMMADMKNEVLTVLGFALFFAFVILTVQFNSVKLPGLILGSVPVCLTGVVYLLHVTGFPFGATVIIGVLVVVAATINDGVLLLTFAAELQEQKGISAFDAVVEAAKTRLRPRVMTTLTTLMGFLPLALNMGEGGDMLQPMAIGAIGGLLLEMPVALFLMPCMYLLAARKGSSSDHRDAAEPICDLGAYVQL